MKYAVFNFVILICESAVLLLYAFPVSSVPINSFLLGSFFLTWSCFTSRLIGAEAGVCLSRINY